MKTVRELIIADYNSEALEILIADLVAETLSKFEGKMVTKRFATAICALRFPGIDSLGLSLGASVSENPTLSIVPIQGEEFTRRVLTPMDASKFEFLLILGYILLVLRVGPPWSRSDGDRPE